MRTLGLSSPSAGRGRLRIGTRSLILALVTLGAFAATSSAASISIQSPAAGSTQSRSGFPLKFTVAGLANYKVTCLVNGRVIHDRRSCDTERGFADLRNGKHTIRLIAYETGGGRGVVTASVSFKVIDLFGPRLLPQLWNGQIINALVPPFRFETSGARDWLCRVDGGRGQRCGPLPGHEYRTRATGFFEPRSIKPGWRVITFHSRDTNRRIRSETRIIGVLPGPGPQVTVTSPLEGSTVTSSPVTIGLRIAGASGSLLCKVNGVRVRNCTGNDRAHGHGDVRTAPLMLPNGPNTVTFRATDVVGNSTTTTVNFIVNDTTPPNVQINHPANSSVLDNIEKWRVEAIHDAGYVECRLRPQSFIPCGGNMPTGAAWPNSSGWALPHPGANGDFTLDMRVTDAQGRQSTASSTFRVADFVAPDAYPIWPLTNRAPRHFPLLFSEYGEAWRCRMSIDGGAPFACSGKNGPPTLVRATCGPHLYIVRLEDGVGNAQTIARNINVVASASVCPPSPPAPPSAPTGPTGPPSGPTGSTAGSGSTGATGGSGPTTLRDDVAPSASIWLKVAKPRIKYSSPNRARIVFTGAVGGDCSGRAAISLRLRGGARINDRTSVRQIDGRCGFTHTRTVSKSSIAGLRTKVSVRLEGNSATVRTSRAFRAPRG